VPSQFVPRVLAVAGGVIVPPASSDYGM